MPDPTDAQLAAQYEAYPYPAARSARGGQAAHHRQPRPSAGDRLLGVRAAPPGKPAAARADRGRRHRRRHDHAGATTGARRPARHRHLARPLGGGAERSRAPGRMQGASPTSSGNGARCSICRARGSARSTTSIAAACCITCPSRPRPAALASVLAPGGGIGLMVYAPHGRTGVYMVQDALRLLAPADRTAGGPARCRASASCGTCRKPPGSAATRYFGDHIEGGDAGLYDLLLNPRDRPFTVPALARAAGRARACASTCWLEPMRYDPATWLPDPKLRARAAALDPIARAALAEALTRQHEHPRAVLRARNRRLRAGGPSCARRRAGRARDAGGRDGAKHPPGRHAAVPVRRLAVPVPLPPQAAAILRLVDGQRTVGAIGAELASRGTGPDAFARAWAATFRPLERLNRLLLAPPPA